MTSLKQIDGDRDNAGPLAGLERADLLRQADQVGGVDGGRLDRLGRRHAMLDQKLELVRVASVL